jgi:hypothetical protein
MSGGVDAIEVDTALANLTEDLGITRVVNQFGDTTNLDHIEDWGNSLRNSLVAQYAIAYTGYEMPQTTIAATAGVLYGGSAPTTDVPTWQAITTGGFTIEIDGGAPTDVTGLDFSAITDMDDVATEINTVLTGATAAWTGSRFTITSDTTGASSSISFLITPGGSAPVDILLAMRSADAATGAETVDGVAATDSGIADINAVKTLGDARRDDAVNSWIYGNYGDVRTLTYSQRDTLLKAGVSNIELIAGVPTLQDSVTLYHPLGVSNPLYAYGESVTKIGNIAYDLRIFFEGDDWKQKVLVSTTSKTTNPDAVDILDIKAAFDGRADLYEDVAWIARASYMKENSEYEIDSGNPARVNANLKAELTRTLAILDITNFLGFFFGESA